MGGGEEGDDSEITWFTYIYSLQKEKRKNPTQPVFLHQGKPPLFTFHWPSAGSSLTFD